MTGRRYLLEQRFEYRYEAPVRHLRHRLLVVPPRRHGAQRRIDHAVDVSGAPVLASRTADPFGNEVIELRAGEVTDTISFSARAVVDVSAESGSAPAPRGAHRDPHLLAATPLTAADGAMAAAAEELKASAPDGGPGLAEAICGWAADALAYEFGITGVRTTAAEALAGGRGVCQDYAHLMLALCRAAGVAARYVSGHLVGEGASHAWVEVVLPGEGAMAFDPTHRRRAREGYVTVAVGRDYADVAPTSGTFVGSCPGSLTAEKRLRVLDPADDLDAGLVEATAR